MSINNNPYIGLRTYDIGHKDHFWGRDEDTKRLADSIIENTSTLIYGCSGCGKSSMINAGLIPTLEHYEKFGAEYRYLSIKIKPADCKIGDKKDFRLWSVVNKHINNEVIKHGIRGYSISGKEIQPKDFSELSLWEKLNLITYSDKYGNPINFLIIIDQFEEIFQKNLNLREIRNVFNTYELMCGYYKLTSIKEINDMSIADLDIIKKYAYKKPVNFNRFVITIRQDFLYELEAKAASYPVLYKNRVHISPLNEEQAYLVITSSKKADGTPWFRRGQAISFIKQLTGIEDFEIDGNPEIVVDPMMLSLYLQELCSPLTDALEEGYAPQPENIIRDFYSKHMNIAGIEALETALLSSDGRYRKQITYEEAREILSKEVLNDLVKEDLVQASKDVLDKLVNVGILTQSHSSNEDWVELRHDKLCEYAKSHIEERRTMEKNIRNHSPLKYLTVHGRQIHENSYYIPDDLPLHLSFLHFIKGGVLNAPDLNLDFSGILQNSSSAHHCELRMRVMDEHDGGCNTEDGIREICIKIVDGKIHDISFFGDDLKPYMLYFGATGITFYYDSRGRVVLKDYYRQKSSGSDYNIKERVKLYNGYTSIFYTYIDDSECPEQTLYLCLDKEQTIKDPNIWNMMGHTCMHRDGNFGYKSEYDNFGCEVKRTFINEEGNECEIKYGYSEVRFERNLNDSIKTISYYRDDEKYAVNSVHKKEYLYDESMHQIIGEISFGLNDQEESSDVLINRSDFKQDKNIILVKNPEHCEIPPYQLVILNPQYQPECVLSYGADGILCRNQVKYRTYFPNGELSQIYDLNIAVNGFAISRIERILTVKDSKECQTEVLYDSTEEHQTPNKIVENLMLAMIKFSIWEK